MLPEFKCKKGYDPARRGWRQSTDPDFCFKLRKHLSGFAGKYLTSSPYEDITVAQQSVIRTRFLFKSMPDSSTCSPENLQ